MPLRIASCQFSIEADLEHNRAEILRLIEEAGRREARVAHFPETALTGYAAVDYTDPEHLDWKAIRAAMEDICRAAAERKMWVLVGSAHRLGGGNPPHNSVYVISDEGEVVERYDKRFCTGEVGPRATLDHAYYSPGDHTCVFEIDGWRCGALICYDYRFPELYRDLKKRGVEMVFQSFHNARRDRATFENGNVWQDIVPATMMCRAASNHFWISATNSQARYSCWPSFTVRPDGRLTGQLTLHEAGVLYTDVDPALELWDAPGPWRERAMEGILHSGEAARDARSEDRRCY